MQIFIAMSNQDQKLHKQKRIARNLRQQQRQLNIAKQHQLDEQSKHYYNKHHALDCGVPHCPMCQNPRRTHKHTLTIQEQSFYQLGLYEEDSDDPKPAS